MAFNIEHPILKLISPTKKQKKNKKQNKTKQKNKTIQKQKHSCYIFAIVSNLCNNKV